MLICIVSLVTNDIFRAAISDSNILRQFGAEMPTGLEKKGPFQCELQLLALLLLLFFTAYLGANISPQLDMASNHSSCIELRVWNGASAVLRQLGMKPTQGGTGARHTLNCQAIRTETALENEPGQQRGPICQGKTRGCNVSCLLLKQQWHNNGLREWSPAILNEQCREIHQEGSQKQETKKKNSN